jgi:hypothetical protein
MIPPGKSDRYALFSNRIGTHARDISIRALAKADGVTENTVKAARRGQRLRRGTVEKLAMALNGLIGRR